jgi:two-component system response regulator AtoC
VLETGTFMRVGSTQLQEADVRVIAASNRPPELAVATGRLREDLLYRLNVFPVLLPPLRDRSEDIALLAEHFLGEVNSSEGAVKRFSREALVKLSAYRWPGNVRELRNAVQRAYVMALGERISDEWLPSDAPVTTGNGHATTHDVGSITVPVGSSIAQAERQLILATFAHCGRNKERTAAVLGVSLKTLYNRLKEFSSEPPDGDGSMLNGSMPH